MVENDLLPLILCHEESRDEGAKKFISEHLRNLKSDV